MKTLIHSICVLLIAAVGCGGPAYKYDSVVTGTVTIDGELARSGTVTFHPVDDSGKIAIGRIHPDGSYSLRTGQGDLRQVDGGTVVPGDYIVTVSVTGPPVPVGPTNDGEMPPASGPSLVAAKYASIETSDLKHTVEPGNQVIILDLERAKVIVPSEEQDDAPEEMDKSNDTPATGISTNGEPPSAATTESPGQLDDQAGEEAAAR